MWATMALWLLLVATATASEVVQLRSAEEASQWASSLLRDIAAPTTRVVAHLPSSPPPRWFAAAAAHGESHFATVALAAHLRGLLTDRAGGGSFGSAEPLAVAVFPRISWRAAGLPRPRGAQRSTPSMLDAAVYRGPPVPEAFDAWAMRAAVPPVAPYRPALAPLLFDGRFSTLVFAFVRGGARGGGNGGSDHERDVARAGSERGRRVAGILLAAAEQLRAVEITLMRTIFVDKMRRGGAALALALGPLPRRVAAGALEGIAVARWSGSARRFARAEWLVAAELDMLRAPEDLFALLRLAPPQLALLLPPSAVPPPPPPAPASAAAAGGASASSPPLSYGERSRSGTARAAACERERGDAWSWSCYAA